MNFQGPIYESKLISCVKTGYRIKGCLNCARDRVSYVKKENACQVLDHFTEYWCYFIQLQENTSRQKFMLYDE